MKYFIVYKAQKNLGDHLMVRNCEIERSEPITGIEVIEEIQDDLRNSKGYAHLTIMNWQPFELQPGSEYC